MIEFKKDRPIYLQISDDIAASIINGIFKPNDRVQSIRELAIIYSVNPNTIQKAMQHLAHLNLIEKVRGIGTIVSSRRNIVKHKDILYQKDVSEFSKKLKNQNYSLEEVVTKIKEEWDK